jgi:hypothetical protein
MWLPNVALADYRAEAKEPMTSCPQSLAKFWDPEYLRRDEQIFVNGILRALPIRELPFRKLPSGSCSGPYRAAAFADDDLTRCVTKTAGANGNPLPGNRSNPS